MKMRSSGPAVGGVGDAEPVAAMRVADIGGCSLSRRCERGAAYWLRARRSRARGVRRCRPMAIVPELPSARLRGRTRAKQLRQLADDVRRRVAPRRCVQRQWAPGEDREGAERRTRQPWEGCDGVQFEGERDDNETDRLARRARLAQRGRPGRARRRARRPASAACRSASQRGTP